MNDDELDTLLARGRLSGAQKEQMLASLVAGVEKVERPGRRRGFFWAALMTAGMAAGSWLVLLPNEDGGFRARGAEPTSTTIIEAGCTGGCRRGSTLMFRAQRASGYLAAWAVGPDGKRVWYFPSDAGEMPSVQAGDEPVVVSRGVLLGEEHTPGVWRVHVALLPTQIARAQLEAKPPAPTAVLSIEIAP